MGFKPRSGGTDSAFVELFVRLDQHFRLGGHFHRYCSSCCTADNWARDIISPNLCCWSSDGIAFLTGLTNANFIYSGLDGVIHLAECHNASRDVPRALMFTVFIGSATSFAFIVGMTYSYFDFDAVLASPQVLPFTRFPTIH